MEKRLNNVVDCHSFGGSRVNLFKERYNNGNVTVIGGFRNKKVQIVKSSSMLIGHLNQIVIQRVIQRNVH